MLVGNKEPASLSLTSVGYNVWAALRDGYWATLDWPFALGHGCWLDSSNPIGFLPWKSLPFTLGNEVSKLQRQKEKRSPSACSWICASSPTWYYQGINFWCAPLNRENAKQSNLWLSVQWEMSGLEWTINISEKYSVFINLHRFTAPKWADQTGRWRLWQHTLNFLGQS